MNKRIRDESYQGFRKLSNVAQKLAQQSVALLMEKGLTVNHRRNWLRAIAAHREYQESLKRNNEASEVIRKGKGECGGLGMENRHRSTERWDSKWTRKGKEVKSTLSVSREPGCS